MWQKPKHFLKLYILYLLTAVERVMEVVHKTSRESLVEGSHKNNQQKLSNVDEDSAREEGHGD